MSLPDSIASLVHASQEHTDAAVKLAVGQERLRCLQVVTGYFDRYGTPPLLDISDTMLILERVAQGIAHDTVDDA